MNYRRFRPHFILAMIPIILALASPSLEGQSESPKTLPNQVTQPVPVAPTKIIPVSNRGTPREIEAAPAASAPMAKANLAPLEQLRQSANLSERVKVTVLASQRSFEWLHRYHQSSGLFLPGYEPALNRMSEEDSLLWQATAAFSLARAARFSGAERYGMRAGQTILTLLTQTKTETTALGVARYPLQPSLVCSRLAVSGMLLAAIHELPDPAKDLLDQGEQLALYIASQQQADGSFALEGTAATDPDRPFYAGMAWYGLMRSHARNPQPAKLDAARKALAFYRPAFRANSELRAIPWLTAAAAESFFATRESAFADMVCEMNDALVNQQVDQADPHFPESQGGFRTGSVQQPRGERPTVDAALYLQSIADACRVLRQMTSPDLQRYERYRVGIERGLEFVLRLQYTEENTLHLVPNYRSLVIGGFHTSAQSGSLRLDQTAWGASALVQLLLSGAIR